MKATTQVREIDPAKAVPWLRLVRDEHRYSKVMADAHAFGPVRNAGDVYRLLGSEAAREDQEQIYVVMIDIHGLPRGRVVIARGARDHVNVELPDVCRASILAGCRYLALAHNHPTGDARPSEADGELTKDVQEAAYQSGLLLLDHVILGLHQFFSFREGKLFYLR